MFAYFIGGPLDLTKKAIKPTSSGMTPGTHYAAALDRVKGFETSDKAEQLVPITRHEYRRSWQDGENVIYVYEGIR